MRLVALRTGRFGAATLAVAIAIGATGLAALPAGAAPPVGVGSISGRVVDSGGTPIQNICVSIAGVASTTTDPSGLYSLTGLATGAYDVQYSDCNPNPTYLGQWYLGRADSASADAVNVVEPADTPLGDVTMIAGVSVQGTVTDTFGTPIQNVNVNVNPTGSGPSVGTQTAADGTYTAGPLPNGSYRVQFSANTPLYAGEYWNDKASWSTADTLTLDSMNGPVQSGVDAQLAEAATIEGTVTDSGGGPLQGICVEAAVPNSSGNWDWIGGSVQTQSDGTYALGGLPATDLRVHFRDCTSGTYIEQWWNGQGSFNDSSPIVLAGGEIRTGVDAQLSAGTSVSGTVTDGTGNPIAGVNVSINPTDSGSSAWAQTNPAGVYTTNALPPGTYTVQFQGTPSFAGEYWNDKLSRHDADVITITGSEGPVIANIDAVLAQSATVSGTVTDDGGNPVQDICVYGTIDTSDGIDGVAWATTAADGTYTLNGVPPTTIKVVFQDCNTVGPYVQEWWNGATGPETATPITVASGDVRTGIDAQLESAGAITGRVTDGGGNPIEGICAQASTPTFVGNLATTDSNGDYAIVLPRAGDYKVQFVACNGSIAFAGEWWNDQPTAATAQVVRVDAGQVVPGIDAQLTPGATGSISGRVVNARGSAMTSACIVAYLPYQFALFAPVQPDGTYTIPNVPSGTYALAFLGCPSGGDPEPIVADPDISGVDYNALWWNGVRLDLDASGDGGPDPIAQGADLVTVTPGTALVGYDACFGCTSITITSITPGPNSLTVAFTTPFASGSGSEGLSSLAMVDASDVSVGSGVVVTYTVTCSSTQGGVSRSASGSASPITVAGLTSGGSYICQVAAASGGLTFATSAASDVLAAGTTASGSGGSDPANESGVSGSLPRTGSASSTTLLRAGFALLLLGLVLAISDHRARRRPLVEID